MPTVSAVNASPILIVKVVVAVSTITLGAISLPAVAAASPEHIVLTTRAEPPEGRYEPNPKPRKGQTWSRGFWMWNGIHYKWVPGEWLKERPGYTWESARWQTDGSRWEFVVGHWARNQPSS
ncbi:YXWGXW repeat-containing protein [Usitatibacter palustris]|uniref:YXWGXW repeat-containing protein n=1 Tax=Usitatibacter palustris TaxID=2732487 RepID=A0A6M4H2U6_9PROT|nr:YXWGXW repeat-containing protein [Usitatibacter palustris]QJR13770.1 hypothetical protein DSM104440_00560 [Usitatibacter palustris]